MKDPVPKPVPSREVMRAKLAMVNEFLKSEGITANQVLAYSMFLDWDDYCAENADDDVSPPSLLSSLLECGELDLNQPIIDALTTFADGFDEFHSQFKDTEGPYHG